MLFDDDVGTDGQAKSSALSGWFGVKKGLNIFFFISGGIPVRSPTVSRSSQ
jgi:hypothetical protein